MAWLLSSSRSYHLRNPKRRIFCSAPCRWIFEREPERYRDHEDIVKRILAGKAPGNLLALCRGYFGLSQELWGKDTEGGDYPWLRGPAR